MDDLKNNFCPSRKFVVRPRRSSKKAPFLNIHRHLRDGQMQSVLGTSAAVGFRLDLGELGGILLHLSREKSMRRML